MENDYLIEDLVKQFFAYVMTSDIRRYMSPQNPLAAEDFLAGTLRDKISNVSRGRGVKLSPDDLRKVCDRYLANMQDFDICLGVKYSELVKRSINSALGQRPNVRVVLKQDERQLRTQTFLKNQEHPSKPNIKLVGDTKDLELVFDEPRIVSMADYLRRRTIEKAKQERERANAIREEREGTQRFFAVDLNAFGDDTAGKTCRLWAVVPRTSLTGLLGDDSPKTEVYSIEDISLTSLKTRFPEAFSDGDLTTLDAEKSILERNGNRADVTGLVNYLVGKCKSLARVYGLNVKQYGEAVLAVFNVLKGFPYHPVLEERMFRYRMAAEQVMTSLGMSTDQLKNVMRERRDIEAKPAYFRALFVAAALNSYLAYTTEEKQRVAERRALHK